MVQSGKAAGQARPNQPKEQKSVSHEAPASDEGATEMQFGRCVESTMFISLYQAQLIHCPNSFFRKDFW
jgi:hypothetical protein